MAKRRPSGDGMVRKREDGRWEGRIVIGHKEDGSPIFKSVFAKTQKDLLPKLLQLLAEYQGVELSGDSDMTLGEWIDRWLRDYAQPVLRSTTLERYRGMITQYIRPALGDKPVRLITTMQVQRFYNELSVRPSKNDAAKTLASSTVRSTHMLLHEIMEAAVLAHLISRNPTNGTSVPKNNYAPKKILTEAQREIFMEAIKGEPLWYDFFYTEMTTGLRLGEICGLQWGDLDESAGTLKIQRTVYHPIRGKTEIGVPKTESGIRTILLPPSTLHLLKERRKNAVTEWIFPSLLHPELPTGPNAAYHRLKMILENAGLPSIRFHDLRHTFATHALSAGVDAKTLSSILGHTNASFTLDTYTHVTTDMQKNAAAVVGSFMDELLKTEG